MPLPVVYDSLATADIQSFTPKVIQPLHPFKLGDDRFIALEPSEHLFIPYNELAIFITVISLADRRSVSEDWLKASLHHYRLSDDVFREEFLTGVVFTAEAVEDVEITPGAQELLKSRGTKWIYVLDPRKAGTLPRPGPYIGSEQRLLEIWRLYDDTNGAFLTSLVPNPKGQPSELHIGGEYIRTMAIAVPSRIRSQPSSDHPLSGLRIAVKDIFQIQGIRISASNLAYYELYPPASKTATSIDLLYQAGAMILGTTKLASFAATEEPLECVDFQAPWNPRGDGYQSPAGSSSGSGAAIAAYPWLDISIGSDTSGSGRRPGHWNGCFAMRPSYGVLPIEGYHPSFPQFDVPTFFGRDIEKCKEFAEIWYGKDLPSDEASLPPRIIYATDYISSISNMDQVAIIDEFVSDLETSLGVKQVKVSFKDLWDEAPPSEAEGLGLQEYIKDACRSSFYYDDYHNLDTFRADYNRKYLKHPYVSPPLRLQWEFSSKITRAERDIAVEKLEVYRKWFSNTVMKVGEYHSIVILPIEEISPRYRDEATTKLLNPVGVPMLFLSPIVGGPELVVPAGQVPYQSKVSGRVEHLPVGISLLASPGRDLKLFDLARDCLRNANRPTSVLTGKEMFPSSSSSSNH